MQVSSTSQGKNEFARFKLRIFPFQLLWQWGWEADMLTLWLPFYVMLTIVYYS
jgi:hypothetical protein